VGLASASKKVLLMAIFFLMRQSEEHIEHLVAFDKSDSLTQLVHSVYNRNSSTLFVEKKSIYKNKI
jgi:hypothetical protein